jgi:transposase
MLGIKVLPKDQNTPFVPQLRPIERVWAELKRRLFANGWTAEKTLELREKTKKI